MFFHPELERGPRKQARDRAARAVCATCPVWAVCRRHGLTVREPYGVWGGLSEDDRALIWTGTPIGDLHLPGFDPTRDPAATPPSTDGVREPVTGRANRAREM